MKTSIPINISGRVYYIDSDAKDLLTEYMNNISYAFQGPEQAEIVADIENRVHELLTEKCCERDMMEAVTIEDVRDVITTIGRPEEMVEEEYVDIRINQDGSNGCNPNPGPNGGNPTGGNGNGNNCGYPAGNRANGANAGGPTPPPYSQFSNGNNGNGNNVNTGNCDASGQVKIQKKYFRDPEHAVFGGVIAGLGYYTGFSVPLMRFLLVVFSLLFGYFQWPILLYILAWIIFPAAKTAKERLEMMGQPVTVSSIGDTIASCPSPNSPANVQDPEPPQQYSTLGQIAIVIAKICLAVIALICIPVGIGAIIGAFTCLILFIVTCLGGVTQLADQIEIGLALPAVGLGLVIGFFACVVISVICIGTIWAAACVLFNAKGLPRKTIITISVITIALVVITVVALIIGNIMGSFQPTYY